MEIQTLVSQLSIEALDVTILHRSTRTNEVQSDSMSMGPSVEVSGRELSAVIQSQHLGLSSSGEDPLQIGCDPLGGNRSTGVQTQAFPTEEVHHRQDPKPLPVAEWI